MEDCIASTYRSLLRAKRLPRKPDTRLEGGCIRLNANVPVRANANRTTTDVGFPGDIEFAAVEVEVCLPTLSFRNRGHESPSQAQIESQVAGHAPIVLDERPEKLPTPSRGAAKERLIVNSAADLTDKDVCRSI